MPDQYGNEIESDPIQFAQNDIGAANMPEVTIRPRSVAGQDEKNTPGKPQVDTSTIAQGVQKSQSEATWTKIQDALRQGYKREEIAAALQKHEKLSIDDADAAIANSMQAKVKQAKDAGYSDDEIRSDLFTRKYDMSIVDNALKASTVDKKWKAYEWDPQTPAEDVKDMRDLYDNLYMKHSTLGKTVMGFVDKSSAIEARREINQLNVTIMSKLKEDGFDTFINPSNGEIMYRDDKGREQEVDSSILNSMYNSRAEITGSIVGAGLGATRGAEIGTWAGGAIGGIAGNLTGVGLALPEEVATVPAGAAVGKFVGAAAGSLVGGMMGAGAGRGVDLVRNAMDLREELDSNLVITQMKEAAIFDGVASIVGAGFLRFGKEGYKATMKAYNYTLAGNTKGAFRALLDNKQITEEQAFEMVKLFESTTGKAAPGKNIKEQAIAVDALTQQGVTEKFVAKAASYDPRIATSVVSDVNARAKDLRQRINSVAGTKTGENIQQEVNKYVGDVKQLYGEVKDYAVERIQPTDFRFNLEKLTIEPVMANLAKKLSGSSNREAFVGYSTRIANASEDRTFNGLMEMRAAVNDFKFSRIGLTPNDIDTLDVVLNNIDSQINKAVKLYMPDTGKAWTDQFKLAKKEYAQMKQLEENKLFNDLTKPGTDNIMLEKSLAKYINSTDSTFRAVMEKLPPKARVKAEAAVLRTLTKKHTIGKDTANQAIDFPALSEALKDFTLTTTEGKALQATADEFAKLFKNDQNLGKITGGVSINKMSGILTDDAVTIAKLSVLRHSWDAVQKYFPTQTGRNIALTHKIEKLLRDPLNAKIANDYVSSLPKDVQPEALSLVKQMRQALAANPTKPQDFKFMYKQSKSGTLSSTDGALGKGVYLREGVKSADPASKVVRHEVNMSRMATMDDIASIVGRQVELKEIRQMSDIQAKLAEKGFLGIKYEDKAMLFDDAVIGVKPVKKGKTNGK